MEDTQALADLLTSKLVIVLIVAAVLGFWIVGAYNRLVRLRASINEAFGAVDAQIRQRHQLLLRWTTDLREAFDDSSAQVSAVEAAGNQLLAVCDTVRQRASSASAIGSLRLAEEALAAARGELVAGLPAHVNQPTLSDSGADLSGQGDRILAADSTLAFARQQFTATAEVYNQALAQFPTTLVAGLFGFQSAGTL